MGIKKFDFDEEAASWDMNPGRVKLANDIANAITNEKILAPSMNVLEFGCGTGLLTLRLRPFVHSITCVDSSPGMLGVFAAKIQDRNLSNITLQLLDLTKGDLLVGSYDLLVCSMTLHHVREIAPLVSEFFKVTAPKGYLCVADLDSENGRFHGENDTVFHNGFDRSIMRRVLEDAGFVDIRDTTAATVMKPTADGQLHSFDVFLITARKID